MKNSLEKRILIFSFLVLSLTILANTGMDIIGFRTDYENALILRSQSLGAALKGSVEKVLGLGVDLLAIEGLPAKCQELVANNPEIAYCAITDPDGVPLYINDQKYRTLKFSTIIKSLSIQFNERVHLIGNGTRYYDTVTPIKTPDGKVAGLVHIGFEERAISDKVARMVVRSMFILVLFLLVVFSLVALFIRRSVMQPITKLLAGVQKISQGALDTKIQEVPVFEFNELAKSINTMAASLKERDLELKSHYQELTDTHGQLQTSFNQLEEMSLELERSEELYKSLLQDASDAIIVLGSDETVRIVNKMAEEVFGYSAAELVGLHVTKLLLLLNVENVPKVHRLFASTQTGAHASDELQLVNKEGNIVLAKVSIISIQQGNERIIQALFRDITKERDILSNLSKSAADLARLNRMKDSFLGLASHELKTPLTVIMGYAELITTDMSDRLDKTVLEMVQNISNAALRLDSIVKDLVDISMIDEQRVRLKFEELDINSLVDSAVNELSFFFSMRHQKIQVQLDSTIPGIKGDRIRLMQLLSNVLGNAIKFTPDGGTISVSTSAKYLLRGIQPAPDHPPLTVDPGRNHHLYVQITVSDTGIGIDRDDQVRIFEKFYEAGNIEEHSSGKIAFKAKGAGLGLAIAKGIVQMHGGDIWVESPGHNPEEFPGSTFNIILPVNPTVEQSNLDYMSIFR